MKKMIFIINMCIAFLLYPFTKHKFLDKNIWIIGGHAGDLYNDNSKAIYEYLLKNNKDIDLYWVLNPESKFLDKVPGNILFRGSIKNYLYYYNSKVIIFSHSPSADIAPYNFAIPILNRFHKKTLKVFLNHGTISFKKRKPMNPKLKKMIDNLIESYDISVASSVFEKNIMINEWSIKKENVFVLGSARHDKLYNSLNCKSKYILYTPTWRDWIKFNPSNFKDSNYYNNIINIINNDKLNLLLEEHDLYIKIYLHHLMHEFINDIRSGISGERIVFLDKDTDLADEIQNSIANITDYSGIAMDFLYMEKPVLFYQFDIDEYLNKVGSYINLDNDLFGCVAYTECDLIDKIEKLILNKFEVTEEYKCRKNGFFAFNDDNNCKRIYDCISSVYDTRGKNNDR